MVCATPYPQNEFSDPQFFSRLLSNLIIFYLQSKFSEKSLRGKFWASTSLKKNCAVETPRSAIHFHIASKSPFEGFTPKDAIWKIELFATKNKAQINKSNYAMKLFMLRQVSFPKISLILQEMKISPKSHFHPFCMKTFN